MNDNALAAAIAAGDSVRGTTSPNPSVGAAIVSGDEIAGVGATQPPGGPHAEVMALRQAGERARGATAVVTLEPCNHTGRTGPCSRALIDAGINRLVYLNSDPFPQAAGGADYLRERGVEVEFLNQRVEALEPWLAATRLGRPHVTLKFAQTLDGFTAAEDGTSKWITGSEARRHVHEDRQLRDAIIVGTGTALADNPSLTARDADGNLLARQPRGVVIGRREVNASHLVQYPDIDTALDALWEDGARDVLVEGGAGLAASFLREDKVDAVRAYVAPMLLGSGLSTIGGGLATTLAEAQRFSLVNHRQVGEDIVINLTRKV